MKNYKNCFTVGKFEQLSRTVFTTENGLPSNQATALCYDKKGTLYVGTDKGLSRFENGGFQNVDMGREEKINMIFCAENGNVFVGAGKTLVEFKGKKIVSSQEFKSDVVDMKIDGDNTQWVLCETMLYRKPENFKDYDLKIGFPGSATKLAVLKDNKVYVATKSDGLYALTGKRWHWSELFEDVTGLVSNNISCLDFDSAGNLWIGTDKGVCVYDDMGYWLNSKNVLGLPDAKITNMAVAQNGDRYFATTTGLIHQHNGKLSYYGYKRWLPNPYATDVAISKDGSICVATKDGISIIEKSEMTLQKKAEHYRVLAEKYNVRKDGYVLDRWLENCGVLDENEGFVYVSDNDGLWTSLYLVGLCYEYAVTKNEKTLELARRCLKAMIKLTTISGKEGFTARALRYKGEHEFQNAKNIDEWHLLENGEIEWLGETSSDEITGHFFAYSTFYDLCANEEEKKEIAGVVDKIMNHIIDNNFKLVDVDGKPTTWANWNPNDLNNNHKWIYEKGTNSLEISAFLKTAEYMTGNEKYSKLYKEFLNDHHFGMNLMQYRLPDGHLIHIDDQLCFINVGTLLKYEKDPSVRSLIMMGLTHHWNDERIEHNAMFNVIYGAYTGEDCDLDVIANELVDFPWDMIEWQVYNSHRKDLNWNYAPQAVGMVPQLVEPLEPHERRLCYSDVNRFACDCGCDDIIENESNQNPNDCPMFMGIGSSKGFTLKVAHNYLIPYWMGRYFGMLKG